MSVVRDITGRIVGLHAESHDSTVLQIAKEPEQRVEPSSSSSDVAGYVVGLGVPFCVRSVSPDQRTVTAVVRGPMGLFMDECGKLGTYQTALLNPTFPVLDRDVEVRVLALAIEGDGTRVTLGFGMRFGGAVGMRGTLVRSGAPHPGGGFVVDRASFQTVSGLVKLPISQVQDCENAVLVPPARTAATDVPLSHGLL